MFVQKSFIAPGQVTLDINQIRTSVHCALNKYLRHNGFFMSTARILRSSLMTHVVLLIDHKQARVIEYRHHKTNNVAVYHKNI